MLLRALAAYAALLFILAAMPEHARAAATQVGVFTDGATFEYTLGLLTAGEAPKKIAALAIQGPEPAKPEYKPRIIIFYDKDDWAKFAALWAKARRTQPPKRTNINGDSIATGEFWDGVDEALINVAVNDDASIEFDLLGKDKWPMLFRLRPKDFEAFDLAVKKVSAHFGI